MMAMLRMARDYGQNDGALKPKIYHALRNAASVRGAVGAWLRDKIPADRLYLTPYTYPDLRDLKKLRYRSVCLGSFIPWDAKQQSKLIMDELGWKGDEVEDCCRIFTLTKKIECAMQGVRDYLKFAKRGYSRVTQMTALDIRNGRLDQGRGRSTRSRMGGKETAPA